MKRNQSEKKSEKLWQFWTKTRKDQTESKKKRVSKRRQRWTWFLYSLDAQFVFNDDGDNGHHDAKDDDNDDDNGDNDDDDGDDDDDDDDNDDEGDDGEGNDGDYEWIQRQMSLQWLCDVTLWQSLLSRLLWRKVRPIFFFHVKSR